MTFKFLCRLAAGHLIRACICLLAALGMVTTCHAQSGNLKEIVDIHLSNTTALQVIESMDKQSQYSFTYTQSQLKAIPLKKVDFDHISLAAAIEELGKLAGLEFMIMDGSIAVQLKNGGNKNTGAPGAGPMITIQGKITDSKTTRPIQSATIEVRGTKKSVVSDEEGNFLIQVRDTNAVLVITSVGYTSLSIRIGSHTMMNIQLKASGRSLESVTVTARRKVNNEAALLNERRISAVVSDGISARNMEKTASITTTQALQRVAGVTITDDKFVAIRGLGDRSVIAELNGARLSSSNPDRSAVPLDLVPASLLDNVTVYKTLTPDRPSDASAGIIELKTKSVPDSLTVEFTAQVGFNTSVGLIGKVNAFRGYNPGFLGENINKNNLSADFKNLTNLYPGGTDQIQQLFTDSRNNPAMAKESYRINQIMLGFSPVATTSFQTAQPNQVYSASFGNTYHIFGDHRLGVILGASYYVRTENRYHAELNQYSIYQGVLTGTSQIYSPQRIANYITPDYIRMGKYLGYQEISGTETINYGGLAGITYQFNQRNEVQLQFVGSRGAQVGGTSLTGSYQNTGLDYQVLNQVNQLSQSYRVFNTYNLQGEHKLLAKDWSPRLSYNASASISSQNEPDFRFSDVADAHKVKFADPNGTGVISDYYAFVVGQVHGLGPTNLITADPNGRRYRFLHENNYNLRMDLVQPVSVAGRNHELKFGINYLKRNRDFTENVLGFPGTDTSGDNGLLQKAHGDLSALVSYRNVGLSNPANYDQEGQARTGGFLYQIRKSPNNYTGYYETRAFYGMADMHLTDKIRLIGGVRFENTDIRANVDTANVYDAVSHSDTGVNLNPNTGYFQKYKPFYSGNLVYSPDKNMNFRFAFSTSLARPELREITNIYEFDPFQFAVIVGNPKLVNQTAKSYDFRWEWFPRTNEVFAVSVFYKTIKNQLTKVFVYNTPGDGAQSPEFPIVEFINDPEPGKVYGMEFEARKDLGKSGLPFKNLFIGVNALIAHSLIRKNADRLDKSRIIDRFSQATSPIFEQAPYSINAYLDYDNPKTGTNITTSFNIVGERLIQVQLDGAPDIYDRPVPLLDVVFSQRFWKRFVVKGFAKNLLNPAYKEVYADPASHGKFYGQTYIHHKYHRGTEFSLGLTYNLF